MIRLVTAREKKFSQLEQDLQSLMMSPLKERNNQSTKKITSLFKRSSSHERQQSGSFQNDVYVSCNHTKEVSFGNEVNQQLNTKIMPQPLSSLLNIKKTEAFKHRPISRMKIGVSSKNIEKSILKKMNEEEEQEIQNSTQHTQEDDKLFPPSELIKYKLSGHKALQSQLQKSKYNQINNRFLLISPKSQTNLGQRFDFAQNQFTTTSNRQNILPKQPKDKLSQTDKVSDQISKQISNNLTLKNDEVQSDVQSNNSKVTIALSSNSQSVKQQQQSQIRNKNNSNNSNIIVEEELQLTQTLIQKQQQQQQQEVDEINQNQKITKLREKQLEIQDRRYKGNINKKEQRSVAVINKLLITEKNNDSLLTKNFERSQQVKLWVSTKNKLSSTNPPHFQNEYLQNKDNNNIKSKTNNLEKRVEAECAKKQEKLNAPKENNLRKKLSSERQESQKAMFMFDTLTSRPSSPQQKISSPHHQIPSPLHQIPSPHHQIPSPHHSIPPQQPALNQDSIILNNNSQLNINSSFRLSTSNNMQISSGIKKTQSFVCLNENGIISNFSQGEATLGKISLSQLKTFLLHPELKASFSPKKLRILRPQSSCKSTLSQSPFSQNGNFSFKFAAERETMASSRPKSASGLATMPNKRIIVSKKKEKAMLSGSVQSLKSWDNSEEDETSMIKN